MRELLVGSGIGCAAMAEGAAGDMHRPVDQPRDQHSDGQQRCGKNDGPTHDASIPLDAPPTPACGAHKGCLTAREGGWAFAVQGDRGLNRIARNLATAATALIAIGAPSPGSR